MGGFIHEFVVPFWVMLACSFTIMSHPQEVLRLIETLAAREIQRQIRQRGAELPEQRAIDFAQSGEKPVLQRLDLVAKFHQLALAEAAGRVRAFAVGGPAGGRQVALGVHLRRKAGNRGSGQRAVEGDQTIMGGHGRRE